MISHCSTCKFFLPGADILYGNACNRQDEVMERYGEEVLQDWISDSDAFPREGNCDYYIPSGTGATVGTGPVLPDNTIRLEEAMHVKIRNMIRQAAEPTGKFVVRWFIDQPKEDASADGEQSVSAKHEQQLFDSEDEAQEFIYAVERNHPEAYHVEMHGPNGDFIDSRATPKGKEMFKFKVEPVTKSEYPTAEALIAHHSETTSPEEAEKNRAQLLELRKDLEVLEVSDPQYPILENKIRKLENISASQHTPTHRPGDYAAVKLEFVEEAAATKAAIDLSISHYAPRRNGLVIDATIPSVTHEQAVDIMRKRFPMAKVSEQKSTWPINFDNDLVKAREDLKRHNEEAARKLEELNRQKANRDLLAERAKKLEEEKRKP